MHAKNFISTLGHIIEGIVIMLYLNSCNKDEPHPPEPPQGKSDYIWSIDTLRVNGSYQINMLRMWGSSETDIYVVGNSDQSTNTVFHYDGQSWSRVRFHRADGGVILGYTIWNAISGTSKNDVWVAGSNFIDTGGGRDSGIVMHFNGHSWVDMHAGAGRAFYAIEVIAPNNVWAAGAQGLLMNFDGVRWTTMSLGGDYFISSLASISPNRVFAIGHRNDKVFPADSSDSFLFEYDGNKWRAIDSLQRSNDSDSQKFGFWLSVIDGVLYSSNPNIYKYLDSGWEKIYTAEIGGIFALSPSTIFGHGKVILEYDGDRWKEYAQFRQTQWVWRGCYADSDDVFFVGSNIDQSFILHGKLR